jgi:hypothetical protein
VLLLLIRGELVTGGCDEIDGLLAGGRETEGAIGCGRTTTGGGLLRTAPLGRENPSVRGVTFGRAAGIS